MVAGHPLSSLMWRLKMPLSRNRVGHGPSRTKHRRQKRRQYWKMGGTGFSPGTKISTYDQKRTWVVQVTGAWKRVEIV